MDAIALHTPKLRVQRSGKLQIFFTGLAFGLGVTVPVLPGFVFEVGIEFLVGNDLRFDGFIIAIVPNEKLLSGEQLFEDILVLIQDVEH